MQAVDWPLLFEPFDLFKHFKHFIQIDILCKNEDLGDFITWIGLVQSRMVVLARNFQIIQKGNALIRFYQFWDQYQPAVMLLSGSSLIACRVKKKIRYTFYDETFKQSTTLFYGIRLKDQFKDLVQG